MNDSGCGGIADRGHTAGAEARVARMPEPMNASTVGAVGKITRSRCKYCSSVTCVAAGTIVRYHPPSLRSNFARIAKTFSLADLARVDHRRR